jgi:hypothetical protein
MMTLFFKAPTCFETTTNHVNRGLLPTCVNSQAQLDLDNREKEVPPVNPETTYRLPSLNVGVSGDALNTSTTVVTWRPHPLAQM